MRHAFVNTAMYFSVPHAMTFKNKRHLCKITELFVEHGCQNHRLSCQIYRLLPHILLVTSRNTMDCYCETSYDNNKDKKIDEICFCIDCNIFLCRPCHGVHKQVRS